MSRLKKVTEQRNELIHVLYNNEQQAKHAIAKADAELLHAEENAPQAEMVNHYHDSLCITRFKVKGGYIYNSFDKGHKIMGSCFVPDLDLETHEE